MYDKYSRHCRLHICFLSTEIFIYKIVYKNVFRKNCVVAESFWIQEIRIGWGLLITPFEPHRVHKSFGNDNRLMKDNACSLCEIKVRLYQLLILIEIEAISRFLDNVRPFFFPKRCFIDARDRIVTLFHQYFSRTTALNTWHRYPH